MPTLANASTDLSTLKIHKFPSIDAFNAAVGNSQIGTTDISFVAGDTSDVPLPTSQDVGNVLTAGASGSMYWGAGGGGGTGGDTVTGKTITLSTTGQALITVNGNNSGSVSLPSAPPSTWLGTTATVGASGTHTHGTIQNNGMIKGQNSAGGTTVTNDQVAIASCDRLVIGDWSAHAGASYPLKLSTISFSANNDGTFLCHNGTWQTPSGGGGGGGATALDELSDVNIHNTLEPDQVLTYNGSAWVNQILGIDDLRDVIISGASDGQVLTYSSGTGWINAIPSGGGSSNHDLTYEVLSPTSNTLTLTFASGTRGYKYIDIGNIGASTLNLTLVINNNAENYIMFNNHSQSDKSINIQSVQHNGVTNSSVGSSAITPADSDWNFVTAQRCKEMSINVIPTTHKIIITTTDDYWDLSYV